MNENLYVTSDLYLTAYLKVNGFKFRLVKDKAKFKFEFDKDESLISYVNAYLTENGNCEPLSYTNAIKNLKNLLHNQ
jgi:hypothetical protein